MRIQVFLDVEQELVLLAGQHGAGTPEFHPQEQIRNDEFRSSLVRTPGQASGRGGPMPRRPRHPARREIR
jgi:hypothetical protein